MTSATDPTSPAAPLRVGLVGAGPWAARFTAPMLARNPQVELTGVWARRPEAAAALATAHGTATATSFDDLVAASEAVAFAVPPDVQADLAARAATAGRAVLLDKPLGLTLEQAERLEAAIRAAGVISLVVLTNRYTPEVRDLLDRAATIDASGARAAFVGAGILPGSPFATPWRLEHGALLDLGPHALDLLDAALGPIEHITAAGRSDTVVSLLCTHTSGASSTATLSVTTPGEPNGLSVDLYGRGGRGSWVADWSDPQTGAARFQAAQDQVVTELVAAVRSGFAHPLDAARALHLQRLLDAAGRSLAAARRA